MKDYKDSTMFSKNHLLHNFISLLFTMLVLSLSACNNLVNNDSTKLNNTANHFGLLKVNVASASNRTALPSFSIDSISDFQFMIECKKDDEDSFKPLKTETNSTGIFESLSTLKSAAFPIEPGDWTFKLTASKEGTTLSGQTEQNITTGENTISFNLLWEDTNLSEKGILTFTLDYSNAETKDTVARVTGQLFSFDKSTATESEMAEDKYIEKDLTITNSKVTYSLTEVPAGNYRIYIKLYDDKSNLIMRWPEGAIITGGQISSNGVQVSSLNPVYTIDFAFNCDDYNLDSEIILPEKYTRFSDTNTWLLPTAEKLTRVGYTFGGWYDNEGLTGSLVTSIPTQSTGDLHYYANWIPNPNTKYTVKHYKQPVNGSTDLSDYELTESEDDKTGTTATQTEASPKEYEGFTEKTFEQQPIAADGSTVINIYYDRDKHSVTYNDGLIDEEITIPAAAENLLYETTYTIDFVTKVVREGYNFTGWQDTLTEEIYTSNSNSLKIKNRDITLSALWTARDDTAYTVKHMLQNLDGENYTQEATQNLEGTTATNTNAEANNYSGFTAQTFSQSIIKADGSTVITIYYDRKLITYTFSLDAKHGETWNAPAEDGIRSGLFEEAFTPPTPVKTGYDFENWIDNGTELESSPTFGPESKTYFARWTPTNYVITYELDGGENDKENPSSYTIEDSIILKEPLKDGAVFDGWYTTSSFSTASKKETISNETGPITLYAKWKYNTGLDINIDTGDGSILTMTVTIDGVTIEEGATISAQYNTTSGKTIVFKPTLSQSGYTCTWTIDGNTTMTGMSVTDNVLTVNTTGWVPGVYDVQFTANKGTNNYESYYEQIIIKGPLGSKKAPTEVGDIVFNDGSAIAYSDGITLSDEQKESAIAVIFYKGTDCSNPDSEGNYASRLLGIGLNLDTTRKKAWCTSSAAAATKEVDSILCIVQGDSLEFVSNPDKDGSDNFSQLGQTCSDTGTSGRYPAFQWAENYNTEVSILSGTDYENGWYLPTSCELIKVYEQREIIDAASSACGGGTLGNFSSATNGGGGYWSSSTMKNQSDRGSAVFYSNSGGTASWRLIVSNEGKTSSLNVCAIREF